jgi:hypothetical protein
MRAVSGAISWLHDLLYPGEREMLEHLRDPSKRPD